MWNNSFFKKVATPKNIRSTSKSDASSILAEWEKDYGRPLDANLFYAGIESGRLAICNYPSNIETFVENNAAQQVSKLSRNLFEVEDASDYDVPSAEKEEVDKSFDDEEVQSMEDLLQEAFNDKEDVKVPEFVTKKLDSEFLLPETPPNSAEVDMEDSEDCNVSLSDSWSMADSDDWNYVNLSPEPDSNKSTLSWNPDFEDASVGVEIIKNEIAYDNRRTLEMKCLKEANEEEKKYYEVFDNKLSTYKINKSTVMDCLDENNEEYLIETTEKEIEKEFEDAFVLYHHGFKRKIYSRIWGRSVTPSDFIHLEIPGVPEHLKSYLRIENNKQAKEEAFAKYRTVLDSYPKCHVIRDNIIQPINKDKVDLDEDVPECNFIRDDVIQPIYKETVDLDEDVPECNFIRDDVIHPIYKETVDLDEDVPECNFICDDVIHPIYKENVDLDEDVPELDQNDVQTIVGGSDTTEMTPRADVIDSLYAVDDCFFDNEEDYDFYPLRNQGRKVTKRCRRPKGRSRNWRHPTPGRPKHYRAKIIRNSKFILPERYAALCYSVYDY